MPDLLPPDAKMVFSSNVSMIGYWPDRSTLMVEYKAGKGSRTYSYENVDPKLASETMNAPSIGEALQVIKKQPQKYPCRGPL